MAGGSDMRAPGIQTVVTPLTERAADDPRWAEDPSPSWDECCHRTGAAVAFAEDTPDDPAGCVETQTQKFWPTRTPALQEPRRSGTLPVAG